MDAEKVIPVQNRTMIEKWLLVLLIVGGTSLVFLICFPIDFYLYRRRKRLARERSSAVDKKPIQVYRAGQYHAQVYPDSVDCATEIDEGSKGEFRDNNVKPSRFVRIVNLFRKKKTESRLMQLQKLTDKSESSSSDNPCVYITENREETSIFRSHDTQITIPGSADQPNMLTPESSHQGDIATSYHGLNQSERNVHENSTNENIPYMAKALSVIMSENEELFTPENRHLNYGSTEKISTVHVTREMIENINNSLFVDETAQSTSTGKQGLDLLGTFDTDTQSQTGTVFFTDTGESSTDNAEKVNNENSMRDKNVITVKSNGDTDTLNNKPPKGHSKRSKSSKNIGKTWDNKVAKNQNHDIQPSSLPRGIASYNLSDTEETGSDESGEDLNDQHSEIFSNNDENRSIGEDRNLSPFFKNITSSFSDQYLSKDRKVGSRLATKQPMDIDEFADNRPSIDLTNSNFSLLEEAAISSRRKKKKKKSEDRLSPNSLPNLSSSKARIKSKQDYYKERRTVSATANKFSKY